MYTHIPQAAHALPTSFLSEAARSLPASHSAIATINGRDPHAGSFQQRRYAPVPSSPRIRLI